MLNQGYPGGLLLARERRNILRRMITHEIAQQRISARDIKRLADIRKVTDDIPEDDPPSSGRKTASAAPGLVATMFSIALTASRHTCILTSPSSRSPATERAGILTPRFILIDRSHGRSNFERVIAARLNSTLWVIATRTKTNTRRGFVRAGATTILLSHPPPHAIRVYGEGNVRR